MQRYSNGTKKTARQWVSSSGSKALRLRCRCELLSLCPLLFSLCPRPGHVHSHGAYPNGPSTSTHHPGILVPLKLSSHINLISWMSVTLKAAWFIIYHIFLFSFGPYNPLGTYLWYKYAFNGSCMKCDSTKQYMKQCKRKVYKFTNARC